jgi:hypothetical protein
MTTRAAIAEPVRCTDFPDCWCGHRWRNWPDTLDLWFEEGLDEDLERAMVEIVTMLRCVSRFGPVSFRRHAQAQLARSTFEDVAEGLRRGELALETVDTLIATGTVDAFLKKIRAMR